MNGKLVVFEGIDGAGTEVQSKKLLEYLKGKGMPAERIEYPDYNGPIGKLIHEFLHNKYDFIPEIQLLLHAADRIKDREKINQLLSGGRTVICDRYYTSIFAYQCNQGIPLEKAMKIAEMFEIPKPDIIIYLKISPETSVKRKAGEKGGKDNLDRNESNKELQGKLVGFYDRLIRDQIWSSWYSIDGEKSIEGVFEQVKKVLML